MKLKIAYAGNRTNLASDGKSFNTEAHIALTLEQMGHEVLFIQENTLTPNSLVQRVENADLFLWTRTWKEYITREDLIRLNQEKNISTVSFHLDKYTGIERDGDMTIGSPFWQTNYVFSPEGSVQAKRIFKSHGINQFYLPPAVYDGDCYITEPVDHFKFDVVFVGGGVDYSHPEWAYRHKLVRWLQETYGDRYGKFGHPERTVRGHELNQLYASAKIAIGDSLCKDFTDSYYYSDRCFEVTGRGGMLITPYIPGIQDHFVDRKESVFYAFDNFVQLKNLIDYYLEHDGEREAIRMAGHERTKTENTYTNRMSHMLQVLKEQGAIK